MAVYILACVALLLIMALLRGEIRKIKLAQKTWDELLREVRSVNIGGITLAALASDPKAAFEPDEVWMMIGGWEGLTRMQANANLLIALASHAPLWKSHERSAVREQMWCDARAIHKAIRRIRFQRLLGRTNKFASSDTVQTAYAYYRMSDSLLRLFGRSTSHRYCQLTAVVWPV